MTPPCWWGSPPAHAPLSTLDAVLSVRLVLLETEWQAPLLSAVGGEGEEAMAMSLRQAPRCAWRRHSASDSALASCPPLLLLRQTL